MTKVSFEKTSDPTRFRFDVWRVGFVPSMHVADEEAIPLGLFVHLVGPGCDALLTAFRDDLTDEELGKIGVRLRRRLSEPTVFLRSTLDECWDGNAAIEEAMGRMARRFNASIRMYKDSQTRTTPARSKSDALDAVRVFAKGDFETHLRKEVAVNSPKEATDGPLGHAAAINLAGSLRGAAGPLAAEHLAGVRH